MGRKKRSRAQLKPFCFYCEREFDDEKVLIQHQKAKHFKCSACNRKLDTATGLVVHMLQVHKETISRVPNSNNGRDNPDLIIHGMDGVPIELLNEKQSKLDEERGAVLHSKSDHTKVGMSIMSGFINQMQQTHPHMGLPQGLPPQMGNQGPPNPFAMNQFMAHMQQGPQAAFTAMFGYPAPKLEGNAAATTLPSIPSIPIATPHVPNVPPSAFVGINLNTQQPTAPDAVASRIPEVLSSTLAAAKSGSQLVFEPPDDSVSPEEIRAQQSQYASYLIPVESH